jgi:DNA-binding GntR family transcriptional regulator
MLSKLIEFMSGEKKPGVPKYAQLREAVLNAIEKGYLKPGDQIPPDLDIVRETRLSLGTVQSAMRAMAEEGVIVRDHGRGTFVAERKKNQLERPWYCRFSKEENAEEFLPVFIKLISCKHITGQERVSRLLKSKTNDFIQIDRRINVGNEFSLYDQFFLDGTKFSDFLSKSTEEMERTNFKVILRREYNMDIKRVVRSMKFGPFSEMICREIDVPLNTVGLIQQAIAYSMKRNPIYLQETYIPSNNLIYHMPDAPGVPVEWA